MHADDSSVPHGDNSPIFSSDSGSLMASLTSVQKSSLIVLAASLSLISWAGFTKVASYNAISSAESQDITIDGQSLKLEVTSPDQAAAAPVVTRPAKSNVEVKYESSQHSSGQTGTVQSSAQMTVNGQEVPVNQQGNTRKVIRSSSSGGSSTVVINVDSQNSSSGQTGGGD